MLKSANYKKGILRQSEFAQKYQVGAKQGARANSKQKKLKTPNEKSKKQNINKRRIYKVEYKTKVNLNKR